MRPRVAIIGAGPAGMAAAIQLKRYGFSPSLFEKNTPGGLLRNANLVENFPGFPGGIPGPALVDRFVEQLKSAEVPVIYEKVTRLDYREGEKGGPFVLATLSKSYRADAVVAACGTRPMKFPLSGTLPEELKKKVLYEVYPLRDIKDNRVLILGAGDAAFDYALNLAVHNQVVLLNRGTRVKALPLLVERAGKKGNISYLEKSLLEAVSGGRTKALEILYRTPIGEERMEADFLLCALGREPEKGFYSPGLLEREDELIDRGLFYPVGDVVNGRYRQVAIALGDGVKCAMKIFEMLGAL